MTLEKFFIEELIAVGLFPKEAQAVLERYQGQESAMAYRWQEDSKGYPAQLLEVLVAISHQAAREWLAENVPNHWARYLLDSEA